MKIKNVLYTCAALLAFAAAGFSPTTAVAFQPGTMALVQYNADLHLGDGATNTRALTRYAEEAVQRGAKIIIFPEGSTYGYADSSTLWCLPGMTEYNGRNCRDVRTVAEELPQGQTTSYWTAFSVRHGVYVLFSVIEKDGDQFFNTTGVAGPTGFVGKYRKRSLYWVDRAYATSGADNMVLQTEYGAFGLMICMDGSYDGGQYAEYKALGVNAIILSMDWDQNPSSFTAASVWFPQRAQANALDIYASDVSTWDGTAFYPMNGTARQRSGLPEPAVGQDGVVYQALNY